MGIKNFMDMMAAKITLEKRIGIFLIILTAAVYWGVTGNGFINYDDHEYVTRNDHVQAGITLDGIRWAFTSITAANWHPVTVLSHMLDCRLYGLNPAGHHLTNLLFHMANVLLLFLVLREATGRVRESGAIAMIFAVHPLHVESVAWISERKDVLSGFFFMLTLLMYVRYVKECRVHKYWMSFAFFILGLMTKPMLVTVPVLLLLMDYWPLEKFIMPKSDEAANLHKSAYHGYPRLLKLIFDKTPFFISSLIIGIVTLMVQSHSGATSTLETLPINIRLANALLSYQRYMEKNFLPANLSVFYPHTFAMPSNYHILGAVIFITGITLLVFLFARRCRFLTFGWLWYLVSLLPVIGIIQVGFQAMADRYVYLPSIGIYVIIVFSISELTSRLPMRRTILFCLIFIVLAFLSANTIHQVRYWKNTKELFTHAASVTSRNWLAHGILSDALLNKGNLVAAESEARKALSISPKYADGHVALAEALQKTDRKEEALAHLQEALRIDPRHAQAYLSTGRILAGMKKNAEAVADYAQAEKYSPANSWSYNILGIAYAGAGSGERAIAQFRKAMELAPKRADTYNNMGLVLNNQNRPREALPYLLRALELEPAFAEAYNNTGVALMKMKNFEKAAYYFSVALIFKPDYEKARGNLCRLSGLMSGKFK